MCETGTRVAIVILAIALVSAPVVAAAQSPQPASRPITSAVQAGDTIWVSVRTGDTLKGQVYAVSPTGLKLRLDRRLSEIRVNEIRAIHLRYRDPVTNGVRKGLLLGLYGGVACGATSIYLACRDGGICPYPAAMLGLSVAFGVVAGAAVGWMVDASRASRREVWRAPGTAARIVVVPTAGSSLTGASVVVTW